MKAMKGSWDVNLLKVMVLHYWWTENHRRYLTFYLYYALSHELNHKSPPLYKVVSFSMYIINPVDLSILTLFYHDFIIVVWHKLNHSKVEVKHIIYNLFCMFQTTCKHPQRLVNKSQPIQMNTKHTKLKETNKLI